MRLWWFSDVRHLDTAISWQLIADELDAIGTKRFDSELSGDREVQRTMLELLNQLDGFSSDDRIKVSFWDLAFIVPGFSATVVQGFHSLASSSIRVENFLHIFCLVHYAAAATTL